MKPLANDPVIISALRTPMGRYGKALASVRPDDMAALLIKETVNRFNIDHEQIGEVILGCANQAGEDNRNIARMASLLAGLNVSIPAITVNRLCASGLDAIIAGARRIITNEAQLIIAGGVESMSRAPYVMSKNLSYKDGTPKIYDSSLGWRFFNPSMEQITPPEANGVTAERLAQKYNISRIRQDEYALKSHRSAISAKQLFTKEIVPLVVNTDEGPREDTSIDKLGSLKPAFSKNGTVTAGNSSSLSDGASVLMLASHDFAKAHGLKPMARILGFASAGIAPKVMGLGPVASCKKLLHYTGLKQKDFSTIEINEAFAAQVLSVIKELKLDEELVNPLGGAIALGHPLGCSGARIVTTMLNHMQHSKKNLGLASLCVGVGQGVSMAVESI